MSKFNFAKVKGIKQVQCKCGALLDDCYVCKTRGRCHSCAKCQKCNVRVSETWRLDPQHPVRFDRKQADSDKGNDLNIPRHAIVMGKEFDILGKGGRIIKAKGLRRKQDTNV